MEITDTYAKLLVATFVITVLGVRGTLYQNKTRTYNGTVTDRHKPPTSTFVKHHQLNCTGSDELPNCWCHDIDDGTPRYVGKGTGGRNPHHHSIPHYTHQGFKRCLANKTVVFIGDSRVRYQFMNLLAFLKEGRFMKCGDQRQNGTEDISCFLIDHESHKRKGELQWTAWYKTSSDFLQEKQGKGQHLCDCFRPKHFDARKTYENRFVEQRTSFGTTRLIYLQNFLNNIRMGSNFPPFTDHFSEPKERCRVGECGQENRTNLFKGNVNATMWNMLPRLNATHAFVQLGWDHRFGLAEKSKFSCTLQKFQQDHPDLLVSLISNPPPVSSRNESAMESDSDRLGCKVPILDRTKPTMGVPQDWYWDRLHVLSILNEEYNHQMIEELCPIE